MRAVQLTLDEKLIAEVDAVAARLGTTRSAFARAALRDALAARRVRAMERRHREGYGKRPIQKNEVAGWEAEQAWPDD